ncbi:MAG: leucyl aminopeptidase [Pseudomonadota bacterium]|nr:leucyl aminopeptidase [Pseudomonadota bacterium]
MKIEFKKISSQSETLALVNFAFSGTVNKKTAALVGPCSNDVKSLLCSSSEITGKFKEAVLFRNANCDGFKYVLSIGLGDKAKFSLDTLRQAAAVALKELNSAKIESASFSIGSLASTRAKKDKLAQVLTEGIVLGSYCFDEYKKDSDKKDGKLNHVLIVSDSTADQKQIGAGILDGEKIASAINFARRLGDTPGNLMTPTVLAKEAKDELTKYKVKVTVWDSAKIKSEKMGSFLGVSFGSEQEPRFIVMEYSGGGKSKKPVALVGKGLTFDSGGISIKPSAGMEEMKFDMCGGANVIGTILAAAKLKLKVNLLGFVPSTENMPGGGAIKPGDILVARNGKSIEINNTDAEGRLILADALVYASEKKPAAILDMATLTGAMSVALGNIHCGFFTRDAGLAKKAKEAAEQSGELVWHMPLVDFHVSDMKGTYADLSNVSTSGRGAGSATAAGFLEQFVDEEIPWAHFDIAGTAWHTGDRVAYNPKKGASGVMIRTWLELIQKI